MQSKLVINGVNNSLIIFFAGWSLDSASYSSFRPNEWDVLYLYDYTDIEMPVEAVAVMSEYDNFAVIGHSFGVAVAHTYLKQLPKHKIAIAICGTLLPVDNKFGIPERVFNHTLKAIGKGGIEEFNKRMCGKNISSFTPSTLPFDGQIKALEYLGNQFKNNEITPEDKDAWGVAVISMLDEIIPVDNQIAFWGDSKSEVVGLKTQSHFPFTAPFAQFITTLL